MINRINLDKDTELRLLTIQDAPAFLAVINHSRTNISEFLPWVDRVNSLADAHSWIQLRLDKHALGEHMTLGIWKSGTPAGGVMYRSIDHEKHECEIGYWLDDAYVGVGLISTACRWMIRYAFNGLGMDHIVIQCAAKNKRSRALPERLGFALEHFLKDDFVHRGINHDSVIYGLWRSDYLATTPSVV